ncbi:hypothetical protein CFE70_005845 [Pyrenophora teres f. teres 0-1]|uniref:Uncharacterized protein n=1 Tax=Pyrenophora teres f. teres TaxID=97479 RepID=A0A6S6W4C4_9PLEO|nr:hypothetical protein HRS9139_03038 [Pyrenophora teres f. teres]CAA9962426.1 hypothetical protein PTMSG1_05800 [Pyrenophora teres f. maculata]KAE8844621.1 hypothetical protein PTNB85_02886 [Pyrenophora teres f. teres]KAE8847179.1 hypothetical protein HRS9122_04086 [Pyrenophora teres f. teres]KAE8866232.1 hypothetical protein PTNB29_03379 [Pyrenophora teres f. teres]
MIINSLKDTIGSLTTTTSRRGGHKRQPALHAHRGCDDADDNDGMKANTMPDTPFASKSDDTSRTSAPPIRAPTASRPPYTIPAVAVPAPYRTCASTCIQYDTWAG